MLYDNAQLALLYLDAEQPWPGKGYATIALQTIDFMNRSLWQDSGAYAASLSAVDKQNNEGAAYLWTMNQLESLLTVKEMGALKNSGILKDSQHEFMLPALSGSKLNLQIQHSILDKLRKAKRPVMPVDGKKLASWNALALIALLKAEVYRPDAEISWHIQRLYRYIREHFIVKGQVIRFAGQSLSAETTLEDYAYLVHALAFYAQQKNDKDAAELSAQLAKRAFHDFYQQQHWIQNVNSLIPGDRGEYVVQDDVLESPVTMLLKGVLLLPEEYLELKKQAVDLIDRMTRDMLDVPYHYASAIMLREKYLHKQSVQLVPVKTNSE
jgi:hypothetical protein